MMTKLSEEKCTNDDGDDYDNLWIASMPPKRTRPVSNMKCIPLVSAIHQVLWHAQAERGFGDMLYMNES